MGDPELTYELEKTLWTDQDFDLMGWHDAQIYAISFATDFEFVLDIDYIFKWVTPGEGETYFKFWVSPCTLVFENVWDLKLEVSSSVGLEINDILRTDPRPAKNAEFMQHRPEYSWIIETQQGSIEFNSVGYKLFVRQLPSLLDSQQIDHSQRVMSFERKEA